MNTVVPGSELTKEPFRWDQRIFGLVLKLPGNFPVESQCVNQYIPSADNHPLDAMCEVTGGKQRNLKKIQSNLSYVTFQGNSEIGSHKTGGR